MHLFDRNSKSQPQLIRIKTKKRKKKKKLVSKTRRKSKKQQQKNRWNYARTIMRVCVAAVPTNECYRFRTYALCR